MGGKNNGCMKCGSFNFMDTDVRIGTDKVEVRIPEVHFLAASDQVPLVARVCTECGHVELHVDAKLISIRRRV